MLGLVEWRLYDSEPGLKARPRNPKTVHSEKFKNRTLKTQGCGTQHGSARDGEKVAG